MCGWVIEMVRFSLCPKKKCLYIQSLFGSFKLQVNGYFTIKTQLSFLSSHFLLLFIYFFYLSQASSLIMIFDCFDIFSIGYVEEPCYVVQNFVALKLCCFFLFFCCVFNVSLHSQFCIDFFLQNFVFSVVFEIEPKNVQYLRWRKWKI